MEESRNEKEERTGWVIDQSTQLDCIWEKVRSYEQIATREELSFHYKQMQWTDWKEIDRPRKGPTWWEAVREHVLWEKEQGLITVTNYYLNWWIDRLIKT